jgi:CheY-like chemotaxis protein
MRILVVDDDLPTRTVLARLLQSEGYEVDSDGDAPDALARVSRAHYDLLVTDHVMPGVTGLELARQATASGQVGHAIIVSGASRPDGVLGAEITWISKPIDADALLDLIAARAAGQALLPA